jgi:SAM-dependent methyltransferase
VQQLTSPETVRTDFDRLARFDTDAWDHNNHYHAFLLGQLPAHCEAVLEVGCGTGLLARQVAGRAGHVDAFDLSPEMIAIARARSAAVDNMSFERRDVMAEDLPAERYDAILSVATLHHLPLRPRLTKFRAALRPGGCLACLDLFDSAGWRDGVLDLLAVPVTVSLRLLKNGHLWQPAEVRAEWAAHGAHDQYMLLADVRKIASEVLQGAEVRRHLLWRYSLVWRKPGRVSAGQPRQGQSGAVR